MASSTYLLVSSFLSPEERKGDLKKKKCEAQWILEKKTGELSDESTLFIRPLHTLPLLRLCNAVAVRANTKGPQTFRAKQKQALRPSLSRPR